MGTRNLALVDDEERDAGPREVGTGLMSDRRYLALCELRNYLTVILGFATLADQALPDGHSAAGDLAQVRDAAARAAVVMRRILTPG